MAIDFLEHARYVGDGGPDKIYGDIPPREALFMSPVAESTIQPIPEPRVVDLRWTVLRFVIATILLTAAVMKAHQLATVPSLGEGLLNARWFNILVVQFE